MVDLGLINYIKKSLAAGMQRQEITAILLRAGWAQSLIDEGFMEAQGMQVPKPVSQSVPSASVPLDLSEQTKQQSSVQPSYSSMQPSSSVPAARTLPGAIALLDEAWFVYRKRFWTLLGIELLTVLIPFILIAGVILIALTGSSLVGLQLKTFSITLLVGALIFVPVFLILLYIFSVWSKGALLFAVSGHQEYVGIREAYRRGWHTIASLWWISLLSGFIIVGGLFLFLIPGVLFMIWFSVAEFVLIVEGIKGSNALLKSREYVRGKWWGVFWRFLFVSLPYLVVTLIPAVIFNFVKIPWAQPVFSVFIGIIVAPFLTAYYFSIYSGLKIIHGDRIFTPSQSKKVAFIGIGLIGIMVPLIFIVVIPLIYRGVFALLPTFVQNQTIPSNQPTSATTGQIKELQDSLNIFVPPLPSSINFIGGKITALSEDSFIIEIPSFTDRYPHPDKPLATETRTVRITKDTKITETIFRLGTASKGVPKTISIKELKKNDIVLVATKENAITNQTLTAVSISKTEYR